MTLKYRKQLFLRWIHALRQTNKIKRKALQIVSSKKGEFEQSYSSLNEEQ